MVFDLFKAPGLQAKTGRAARGRPPAAGMARPTPPPLVAADGCVLQKRPPWTPPPKTPNIFNVFAWSPLRAALTHQQWV